MKLENFEQASLIYKRIMEANNIIGFAGIKKITSCSLVGDFSGNAVEINLENFPGLSERVFNFAVSELKKEVDLYFKEFDKL